MFKLIFKCPCCHLACEAESRHIHHILPRSLGGSDDSNNKVEICEECHGRIHEASFKGNSELVKKGLERAKARGVKLGRQSKFNDEEIIAKVLKLRKNNQSLRAIASNLKISYGVVCKIVNREGTGVENLSGQRKYKKSKPKRIYLPKSLTGECQTCKEPSEGALHNHHIVALSSGGVDDPSNIISICGRCHSKIHDRSMTALSRLIKKGLEKKKEAGIKLGRKRKVTRETVELILKLRDIELLSFGQIQKSIVAAPNYGTKSIPLTTVKSIYAEVKTIGIESYLYASQMTSDKIKQGLLKAKENGIKLGQPAIDSDIIDQIKKDRGALGLSYRVLAKKYGVSFGIAYKACNK